MGKKKKKKITWMLWDIEDAIYKLEYKRDFYMYDRPNDETVNQIDRALIQIRKYKDMLYKQL